jgi:hypothetical protein
MLPITQFAFAIVVQLVKAKCKRKSFNPSYFCWYEFCRFGFIWVLLMKFDGLFIFLLLSHSKTMDYEGLLSFMPLSNFKTMNLNGLHLFLLLSDSRGLKSNGIFIFLPLLDSRAMNLIMIFLSLVFIRFYNHELKVFSCIYCLC